MQVTEAPTAAPEPELGGRRPVPALVAHVAALVAVLVAVALLGGRSDSWTPDDGAYALQVRTLEATGGWAYPYAHADIDPGREHIPFTHGLTTDAAAYPYVKHPAWIAVLRASTWALGDGAGLVLPSLLGVVGAAVVAWRLARRVGPGAEAWAFWAVGASGLLVSGTAFWAHTVAAALAGLCVGAVLDAATGRRVRPLGLALALAGLGLIRSEGLLLAAATLLVIGACLLARPGTALGRVATAGRAVALPAAAVVGALAATRLATDRIVDGTVSTTSVAVRVSGRVAGPGGRIDGAVRSLVDGAGESRSGTTLAVVALVLVAGAGLALVRRRDPRLVVALVAGGLALMAVRTLVVAPRDLAGWLTATPLLVLGLAAAGGRRWGPGARAVAATGAVYAAAVLATQYPEGGARDWGGRFFLPLLVPAVVAAVVLLRDLVERIEGRPGRRAVTGAIIALVVVPTVLGLEATGDLRDTFGRSTDRATATGADVVVRLPEVLARLSWKAMPRDDWLAADRTTVGPLLADLRASGAGTVAVIGSDADEIAAPRGYHRDVRASDLVVFTPSG